MIFLIFIYGIFGTVLAENRGDSCITPNNEPGKCIPVRSCDVILKGIESKDSSAYDFAKKSQCGYDTVALVCCGPSGSFNPTKGPSSTGNQLFPDRTVCGLESESGRVKGGEQTELEEFPWMAALEYVNEASGKSVGIKCGGTLINKKYVVTAAHCILADGIKPFSAWLGEWKISTNPDCRKFPTYTECADPVQKIRIQRQLPHPAFSSGNVRNDIGLLRLEREVQYSDYIRPICLPTKNTPVPNINALLTVAGWGIADDGRASDVKMKVSVPFQTNEACNAILPVPLTPNQYCAGGERGKDSCRGDSGGPLMRVFQEDSSKRPDQPQWLLEGVVSYGIGCGREGYPAIYTRVSRYMDWMAKTITQDMRT